MRALASKALRSFPSDVFRVLVADRALELSETGALPGRELVPPAWAKEAGDVRGVAGPGWALVVTLAG